MSPAYLYGVDAHRENKALDPARVQWAVLREPLRRGGVADASGCGEAKHFAVISRCGADRQRAVAAGWGPACGTLCPEPVVPNRAPPERQMFLSGQRPERAD